MRAIKQACQYTPELIRRMQLSLAASTHTCSRLDSDMLNDMTGQRSHSLATALKSLSPGASTLPHTCSGATQC